MAHRSMCGWIGLLLLAGSASAATVGEIRGKPVTGRPLEVNVPFAVDEPKDRACASASVRYGSVLVPRVTVDVQGRGLNRNLLLTSRANVNEPTVTVSVRVGCGAKAVTRKFVLSANLPTAKSPSLMKASTRAVESDLAPPRPAPRPVVAMAPAEPLFPPAPAEAPPPTAMTPQPDPSLMEELRKARSDAATAVAQLASARKELAAVLDVERRTQQTLINAEHQVRDAKSEVAHMRLVLKLLGAGLLLGAAGLVWWEFQRAGLRLRLRKAQPPQEPVLSSGEVPA